MPGAGSSRQPEQRTFLTFPLRPAGDGKAVQDAGHHWYELAQEIHGAFADLDRVISGIQWSGDGRTAFDARWAEFSGHGTEASQHSHAMGDHLVRLGNQITDAQHEWDLAMTAMTASTAIGIGLTFVTFGISDVAAEEAAAASVGTMEAVCAALDISLEAAVQVLAAAIRVAAQLAVRFSWQLGINVISQETANVVTGRGLDDLNLGRAADAAVGGAAGGAGISASVVEEGEGIVAGETEALGEAETAAAGEGGVGAISETGTETLDEAAVGATGEGTKQSLGARLEALADDPDRGGVTPGSRLEARDALSLERSGDVPPPLRRANGRIDPHEDGADFVDGEGGLWDHKIARSGRGFDVAKYLDKIQFNDLRNGESIMLNHEGLTAEDRAALLAEIEARGIRDSFKFIPPL
jgi:hypothetical protein